MSIEVFKFLHGLCPPVLSNLVQKREISYNFRYSNIVQVPTVRTSTFTRGLFGGQYRYYGTHSLMILENILILTSFKV